MSTQLRTGPMVSHQARAVASFPRAAAAMAGGGRGGAEAPALRAVYRMLVQPRVLYGGGGDAGGEGGQPLPHQRRHKLWVTTGWAGRLQIGCDTR